MDGSLTRHVRKGKERNREQGRERISIQDQVDNLTVGRRAPRDWAWF